MSDTPIYPKRGCMGEDGKFYTHTDGSVYETFETHQTGWTTCSFCAFGHGDCLSGRVAPCEASTAFKIIEGAYVLSDEELEACEMARKMIRECCTWMWGTVEADDCSACLKFTDRSCPARVYLASKHDPDAWSVK